MKILILILLAIGYSDSKQVYVTLQMMDQVMALDTQTLQIDQSISTEFNQTSGCSELDNEDDCNISDECEWMMEMCMENTGNNTMSTPHFIALDEINGYWFVTTIASGFIIQYSLLDNSLIDAYFVGDAPALLSVDSANKKVYCSRMMPMNGMGNMMPAGESNIIQGLNYSSMGLSESENQEYIINSPAPHGLAINANGSELYTASNTADWIYKINTITHEITGSVMDSNVDNTPDQTTQRLKPIQCLSTGNRLFVSCSAGLWYNPSTGEQILIQGKLQMWNSDTMELIDDIDLGEHSSPWHIVNSPTDELIYVVLGGDNLYDTEGVASVKYTDDNLELEWQSIPQNSIFDTLHGIDVSSDGSTLYVSGRGDGHMHIFNASDGAYISSISLGNMSMLGGLTIEKKGTPALGDINNDNNFNVVDIVSIVSIILFPVSSDPYPAYASDLSEDQIINVVDIVELVNIVLNSN